MKQIKISLLICTVLIASGCSDFLEEYSQDLAKVETWEDLDELLLGDGYLKSSKLQVVNSSYDQSNVNQNFELIHFMSDELVENIYGDEADVLSFRKSMFPYYTWQQDTGMNSEGKYTGGDEAYWNRLYKHINTTNMVLAVVDKQPEENEEDRLGKERVKGEAHFLRAAYYFMLVNLYAQPYVQATASDTPGVPLKLSEFVEDIEYERASVAKVYEQIIQDLEQAEACLQGKSRKSVYHANLTAANLLQSRVYLYMQNWEKAMEYANKAMTQQNALYDLHSVTPGTEILTLKSPETIFSMGGFLVAFVFMDDSVFSEPTYYVSDDMLDLYADNDLRRSVYIGESDYGLPNICTKVNGQYSHIGNFQEVSDCFLFRTAEIYLNLAEAAACAGQDDVAHRTLKEFLKSRMDGDVEINATGEDLVRFIRDERARELLLEGHRWFDLRRYTVCTSYPYSKAIVHGYTFYANWQASYTDYYRLEPNDKAYTLPIPREVYNFQISLGNNERPARGAYERKDHATDYPWDW